jgi:asparagine synthase (glutamine-hydrolysing)
MCGIAGLWRPAGASEETLRSLTEEMTLAIRRRGPDDSGCWIDTRAGLALGHRRLSVVDLSPTGAQPQSSANGRWVVSYNGEIYNTPKLRARLVAAGVQFRGRSDTEVLLEAVAAWGLDCTLAAVDGMFALTLWDRQERELYLARDRFGEKPLVYGWTGSGPERTLVFASDLRAVRALPFAPRDIDPEAAALMLQFGYVPAPRTIHKSFRKVVPGTSLRIDGEGDVQVTTFWDTAAEAERAASNRLTSLSFTEAADELERLIRASVKKRMIADVPVGAFLSGGIDSSVVTALMQQESSQPVPTFSVGMPGQFDETKHAQAVAAHLGTEHHALHLDAKTALDLFPQMAEFYDEPFGDTSQLPTFLVSQAARKQVTVALTGDAGDEIFLGYQHYAWMDRQWRQLQGIPGFLRKAGGSAIGAVGTASIGRLLGALPGSLKGITAPKIERVARALLAARFTEIYEVPIGALAPAQSLVALPDFAAGARSNALTDPAEWAGLVDTLTSLPDDILAKVDRASMAASLECRIPFLDPAIARFVWSLPTQYRIGGSSTKAVLKEVLHRHVPKELVDRPKMGFSIPRADWLRGPFAAWGSDLLGDLKGTILDEIAGTDVVLGTWNAHLKGDSGYESWLWHALALRSFELQVGSLPTIRA